MYDTVPVWPSVFNLTYPAATPEDPAATPEGNGTTVQLRMVRGGGHEHGNTVFVRSGLVGWCWHMLLLMAALLSPFLPTSVVSRPSGIHVI